MNETIKEPEQNTEALPAEEAVPEETAAPSRAQSEEAASAEQATSKEALARERHLARLEKEAEPMKEAFPGFDLQTELKNPVFARMTAPDVGISVEDAYYAVHRAALREADMQRAAQITAEKIAGAIRSGNRRPNESGSPNAAPFITVFDYAKASKAQREAFKKDIRARIARGEKVYPS